MDHTTFFITNIATMTVFTVTVGLLAWFNPRIAGIRWLAFGLLVALIKLILQGFDGRMSPVVCSMTANQLYLVACALQFQGLHWFVARRPMRNHWLWITVGIALMCYSTGFLARIPYIANFVNIPFVAICFASAWLVLKYGTGAFTGVSRVTAVIMCAQGCVAAYRAVLTNLNFPRPWETAHVVHDPKMLYSLAAGAFLADFMVMCILWFLVTELQRELAVQARTDPLTGAMNRRALEEAALREVARSNRSGQAFSMIAIDIDRFKLLNDTRGHAAGDRALQTLVSRIRSILRKQDWIARTGGEEFAVLLPETAEMDALTIAERVRQAVEELEIPFDTGPIKITICAGVAQFDRAGGWEGTMKLADLALYEAKNGGRNLVSARVAPGVLINELRRQADANTYRYVQAAFGAT